MYNNICPVLCINLKIFEFLANLLYYKGLALFNNKDLELALQALKRGSELVIDNPNFKSNFYALIGDIQHDLKNDTDSDSAYDIAIKLNPNNVFVLNNYSYYLNLSYKSQNIFLNFF